jgi:hypothetical protein
MVLQAHSTIEHLTQSIPTPALSEEDNMNTDVVPLSEDPPRDYFPLLLDSVGYQLLCKFYVYSLVFALIEIVHLMIV